MKKILIYILAAGALLASCKPVEILPVTDSSTGQPLVNEPITSVTAYVKINGVDAEFTGYPDENNNIEIVFPFYYPIESDYKVTSFYLEDCRVMANLASNVTIKEKLFRLDLNEETTIHVTDQLKQEREYVIYGVIKHLDLKEISDITYTVSEKEFYKAIVKDGEIMIPYTGTLPDGVLTFTLSPHATAKKADGSPLGNGYIVNFDEETFITVVADDGSEQNYRVYKGQPEKKDKGLNPDPDFVSYMFSRKLNSEVGITKYDATSALAVSGDYLIINTRGEDPVVLDRFTGANVGAIALPDECKKGNAGDGGENYRNFCMTSDDDGNILIVNRVEWKYGDADAGIPGKWRDLGEVKIWRLKDINSAPEEYISWPISDENYGLIFGRRISVTGSLNSNAVITLPCNSQPTGAFYRWTVKDGELQDNKPEWVSVAETGYTWNYGNVDIVHMDADPTSDFLAFGYSDTARKMTWFNGRNNSIKKQLELADVNYVGNALDIYEFNGTKYLAAAQLNSFTWGRCDFVYLFDLTLEAAFEGEINPQGSMGYTDNLCPALVWEDISGEWGPKALEYSADGYSNANHCDDVIMAGSDSGYYMYLYFMFCNGYVVGVQFDCINRGGE